MLRRFEFAICAILLITAVGCGQSSSPTTTSPSPTCSYVFSIGNVINGYPMGGSFTMAVTTSSSSGCNWTATSQAPWIHVPANAMSNGTGAFTFTVDPDPGPARSGTLTVA